jgi:hypothetical protein
MRKVSKISDYTSDRVFDGKRPLSPERSAALRARSNAADKARLATQSQVKTVWANNWKDFWRHSPWKTFVSASFSSASAKIEQP